MLLIIICISFLFLIFKRFYLSLFLKNMQSESALGAHFTHNIHLQETTNAAKPLHFQSIRPTVHSALPAQLHHKTSEEDCRLLFLRVYGSKKVLDFPCKLITLWNKFNGSCISIFDPAFVKYELNSAQFNIYKTIDSTFITDKTPLLSDIGNILWRKLYVPAFILLSLFELLIINIGLNQDSQYFFIMRLSVSFLVVSLLFIKSIPTVKKITRRVLRELFIDSEYRLQETIDNDDHFKLKDKKGNFLKFNTVSMYCYDDTWKLCLGKMLRKSNVVLMDLREFSEKNIGTAYEIAYLMKNFDTKKILILFDEKSNKQLVLNTFNRYYDTAKQQSNTIFYYDISSNDLTNRQLPFILSYLSERLKETSFIRSRGLYQHPEMVHAKNIILHLYSAAAGKPLS